MPRPSELALPHIAALHAYTPGLQPTDAGWVKLNTNECPYPPSPRVAEALRREIGEDGTALRLYPNPRSSALREVVANLHGLKAENVCIGNGSDDVLNLLVRVFASPNAGYTFPSYSLYPVLVAIHHGGIEAIDFDRSMKLPIDKIAASPAPIFFLTSPNAPTGVAFSPEEIEEVLKRYRGILVVDEAYALFARKDAVPLLSRYPNLVITRTLSKAYALAGIRIGYVLAAAETIDLLDRVRDSYNTSRLSQIAAIAALQDGEYYSTIVEKIKTTRDFYIEEWRRKFGWFVYQSEANFIFVEPKTAKGEAGPAVARAAFEFFNQHKVLVRYFPSHALTASFLRISVGTDDEMLVVDETFQAWRKNA
ncbi:MAG TPA: histidinol-phosphate transaminase [Opitutaceae bacterium]|nr:histidinol-phosphate transaminase [Opitutaceae bacterium]